MSTSTMTPTSTETMRERFYRVTGELLDERDDLAVVLAVIGLGQLADAGIVARHPTRVVDVGIREQTMIGVAAGLALEGIRPIVHTYAPFLVERPFEQVKLDFAHQDVGAVLVSVGASHDWAEGGRTHMSPGDVALMSTLPGWEIHVPGHPDEAETVFRRAVAGTGRVYIRLADRSNRSAQPADGSVVTLRRGSRGTATVLAVGPMLDAVLLACTDLDVTVAYTATVRPLDAVGLRGAVDGSDVVVVEPSLEGTSAAAVTEVLRDRPIRLLSIGVGHDERRNYGTRREHDAAWGLDADGLRSRITAFGARTVS